jgi:hypothetical protein
MRVFHFNEHFRGLIRQLIEIFHVLIEELLSFARVAIDFEVVAAATANTNVLLLIT